MLKAAHNIFGRNIYPTPRHHYWYPGLYFSDEIHLSDVGTDLFLLSIKDALEEALKENARAIKAAHHSVTRLMDRIMTTARRTVMDGQQQYNAKGSLTGGVVNGTLMPTKLNQEL